MNPNQPLNFLNNHFIYKNGRKEYFNGERAYVSLPNRNKVLVNNRSLWGVISQVYIPVSQMCASVKEYQFCNSIDGTENIAFYDLETDDKENFSLGFVNEKKFTDAKKMAKELMNYDIVVAFNSFRFDNEVLQRQAPECFIEVKNKNFSAHAVNGVLNIDMFSIITTIVGKESYSAEAIARECGFDEEIPEYEDKENKCKTDIKINKLIWEKYNIPKVFNAISSLINTDTTLWQIIKPDRVRKWILINKYLQKRFLPLKKPLNEIDQSPSPIKFFKGGFYTDMKYLDITSTYSQTAVNFGDLGIYDDNLFSELQKDLLELAKDKALKPFMKSISNPLVGSQFSKNEHFRNEEIFQKIVQFVAEKVQGVIDSREDVVYTNTDCWIVPLDSPDIEIDGYEIKRSYEFSELYVYNNNKWIGKTKEGIQSRGFRRINSKTPNVLKIAREEIHKRLSKTKGEEFRELLEDPEQLVKTTLKGLKKFSEKDFKMTIRKKGDYCWDLDFSLIWDSLDVGFNDLYYTGENKFSKDPNKISYKYYKELILNMANEYLPEE